MGDNLTNPDGSIRRFVYMHPNRHNPPSHLQHYPPRQRHINQSTHHHPHPPSQVYNYNKFTSNTMPVPVITSSNNMSYQNITMQQSFQHQISVDRCMPRGSYVAPVRVPAPVQKISAPQPPPKETPPPVRTPQPASFLPSPMEILGAMVPVSTSNQHEQKKKDEKEKETDQVPVNDNKADIIRYYRELGQALHVVLSCLEHQTEKVKSSNKVESELRAMNEVLNGQKNVLEQDVVDIRNKNEKIVQKAEKDVQRAKSEEAIWRNKFIECNNQLQKIKNESEEKDHNIRVLIEKAADNETKITQLEVKVLNFEMSERKLNKELQEKEDELDCFSKRVVLGEMRINELEEKVRDLESSEQKLIEKLEEKDKNIKMLERKHEKKCEQFIKMKEDLNKMTAKNNELNIKISQFVKKEKANEKVMQELETNFKLRVQELEAKFEETSIEFTAISDALENEREDNQIDREKMNQQLEELYEQVRVLKNCDSDRVKELEKTILQRNDDFSKISQDLENKKNDNELKVADLKEKNKIIKDLKDKLNSLESENDELQSKVEIVRSIFPEYCTKLHKQTSSCSSSSSGNDTSLESSSSSITQDGYSDNVGNSIRSEAKRPEPQDVSKLSPNKTLGKRTYGPSIKSSAVKKQREDDHNGRQNKLISFPEISHIHFNQKSNTEGGTEVPEMSITSRSTRSRMGRRQENTSESMH